MEKVDGLSTGQRNVFKRMITEATLSSYSVASDNTDNFINFCDKLNLDRNTHTSKSKRVHF